MLFRLIRNSGNKHCIGGGFFMRRAIRTWVSLFLVFVIMTASLTGCSRKNSSKTTNDTAAESTYSTSNISNGESTSSTSNATNGESTSSTSNATNGESTSSTISDTNTSVIENSIATDGQGYDLVAAESPKVKSDSMIGDNNSEVFNVEEYNAIIENNFQTVKNNPLSTFSVDVDTASYSNIRRMIYQNGVVQADAVRIEEMINYFKYDYEKPTGNLPFSVNTELSDCPWNENAKLLLIGLQAEDIDFTERPSSNIVFLLDVSGSMTSEDKLPLMQKAFALLTENLNENDRISIVTYAGEERVVLEGASGDENIKIVSALEELSAGGSTAGAAGIQKAYELAEEYFIKDGNNRVILATDGDLNIGISSEGELTKLIEDKRKNGVFLSVLGFGTENIKDNKLEALADHGNGNYAYIDSILEAKKVLVEQMGGTLFTVAKDVKLQVEFNPVNIKGYRLIGYENRMLNTEDFEDDTKDAGEIGAGHRVTALYELLETDSKQELPDTDLKYQSEGTVSDSDEWLTINIRYKEPDQDKSELISETVDESIYSNEMPENLAFASSVAAFGMLLRDSALKGTASYQIILDILEKQNIEDDEYKDEFISLVKKMMRTYD